MTDATTAGPTHEAAAGDAPVPLSPAPPLTVPPSLVPWPLAPLTMAGPVAERAWTRLDGDDACAARGPIVEEVPVAFVYGARAHVVVMATPADLEDLAVGFTVTEGIVAARGDIGTVRVERHATGAELRIEIPAEAVARLDARSRALPARSGCGLCGVEAIADAVRPPRPVTSMLSIEPAALYAAARALGARQELNRDAHALHAAAWVQADGTVVIVREDVGRHNALDKVVGALLRGGVEPSMGMLLVTSRASVELVQKAAAAGVGILAAVSRPTALAIAVADACDITLIGLVRDETANIYSHARRVHGAVHGAPAAGRA